jgi:sigma-B regulation protein RsbU (phosphoserine phosphatase)
VIDLTAASMTYCRAGHTPMIYLPARGPLRGLAQVLQPGGLVVGLRIDGIHEKFCELLEEETVNLERGDVFVLYTDGVTEAMDRDGELFGEGRLRRIVEEHGHLRSAELRERILREVEAFVGEADQHDDLTLILIKVADVGAPVSEMATEAVLS